MGGVHPWRAASGGPADELLAGLFGSKPWLALVLVALWGLAFGAIPVINQRWMYQAAPQLYENGSSSIVTVFQLFLAAGAVIQALRDEHSLFKMGGLRREMPLVFWTFLIGSASLSALPLVTAGKAKSYGLARE